MHFLFHLKWAKNIKLHSPYASLRDDQSQVLGFAQAAIPASVTPDLNTTHGRERGV